MLTVEEHGPIGGLGSLVCQALALRGGRLPKMACLSLPDEPVIAGKPAELFAYYGLNGEGIAKRALALLD